MPRILAVDWGERRIGVAVSDPTGTIATGLDTIQVGSPGEAPVKVAALAASLEAESIVVGMPLLLSGRRGAAADAAEAFTEALRTHTALPVQTWDERLTSALAQRRMIERGERASRDRGRVDQGAAVALLESWLQKLDADRRSRPEAG